MERALPPATIAIPSDAVGTPAPEALCPSSPMRAYLLPNPSSLPPALISVSPPPSSSPLGSPSSIVTYTSPDPLTSVPPIKDEFVSWDIQTLPQGATYRQLQAEHEAASYYLSSALMEGVEGVLPSSSPSSSPLFPILSSGETSSSTPQSPSPPLSSPLAFTPFLSSSSSVTVPSPFHQSSPIVSTSFSSPSFYATIASPSQGSPIPWSPPSSPLLLYFSSFGPRCSYVRAGDY